MTPAYLLSEIASSRATGMDRRDLVLRFGGGVRYDLDHLLQLELIRRDDDTYWAVGRYFPRTQRSTYTNLS